MLRVTLLGSGTSHGVPAIGCCCPVCTSPDPRDRRTRCAIHLVWRGRSLLVDTPPELRLQALRSHLTRVDALLYTHAHADHVFGLDDVRRFNELQGGALPVYGTEETLAELRRTFRYVFDGSGQPGGGRPRLELRPLEGALLCWEGLEIGLIPVLHGALPVMGLRFGKFAYVTDVSHVPASSRERLRDLDTLVVGALRWEAHSTHFTIPQALELVEELRPRRTYLTHLAHTVAHRETEVRLPPGVRLAYDGLILQVPEDA